MELPWPASGWSGHVRDINFPFGRAGHRRPHMVGHSAIAITANSQNDCHGHPGDRYLRLAGRAFPLIISPHKLLTLYAGGQSISPHRSAYFLPARPEKNSYFRRRPSTTPRSTGAIGASSLGFSRT